MPLLHPIGLCCSIEHTNKLNGMKFHYSYFRSLHHEVCAQFEACEIEIYIGFIVKTFGIRKFSLDIQPISRMEGDYLSWRISGER